MIRFKTFSVFFLSEKNILTTLVLDVTWKWTVWKMWKLLFAVAFLSVDAQRLKLNLRENVREGIEISDMSDVEAFQEVATYRLPNVTRPESYLLNLNFGDFHENDMNFTGNVLITIRVVEETNTITLHNSLIIVDTSLTTEDNLPILHRVDFDTTREFMFVKTETTLLKNSLVRLVVNHQGLIRTSVSGVYRGSYRDAANERRCFLASLLWPHKLKNIFLKRYFIATHMQPTFFRRVWPSYDEPQFKATFSLVLRYNGVFKAISNMPEEFSTIE
jgi:aminopeptidase N